jgi:hypothetical protein
MSPRPSLRVAFLSLSTLLILSACDPSGLEVTSPDRLVVADGPALAKKEKESKPPKEPKEKENKKDDGVTPPPSDPCDVFSLVSGSFDLDQARADATSKGGVLAHIASATEQACVTTLVNNAPGDYRLGGVYNASTGQWEWTDWIVKKRPVAFWNGDENGTPVGSAYVNWMTGEPNFLPGQACSYHKHSAGQWLNEGCGAFGVGYVLRTL